MAGVNFTGLNPDLLKAVTDLRQDLHRHPELAFTENRTAQIVTRHLQGLGLELHSGIAKTGVVGVLDFGPGPVVGFRADMDALPIREMTGMVYASRHAGIMHACGHDGHTAMLLGAASVLATRTDLTGRLVFIFQPAEENEGGARVMLEDGLFTRFPVDRLFALHNMPAVPVGTIMARSGYVSAAFDTFTITIAGQGGHGAMPHTACDPTPASAALVQALNSIVSRNIDPMASAVVTLGQISGGASYNVIPDTMLLKGSCRSLEPSVQKTLKRRIDEICRGTALAWGVDISCIYEERYPAVYNEETATAQLHQALSRPDDGFNVISNFDPLMGSEDFAFMAEQVPACYFILGNGDTPGPLHSPTYDFNDQALPVGIQAWVRLAETTLAGTAPS